jgi:hypothetical protein
MRSYPTGSAEEKRTLNRNTSEPYPSFLRDGYSALVEATTGAMFWLRSWRRPPGAASAWLVWPSRDAPPSLGERAHPLRALWRGGDGVRRGRGEVEELWRERRDELVEDRLQRHQGGGPPLVVHDGDMPGGAAKHLV